MTSNTRMISDGQIINLVSITETEMGEMMGFAMPPLTQDLRITMDGEEITHMSFMNNGFPGDPTDLGEDFLATVMGTGNIPQVDEAWVVSQTIEERGNDTVVTIIFDGNAMIAAGLDDAAAMGAMMDFGADDVDVDLGDVPMVLFIGSDGNPRRMTMEMDMNMEMMGESVAASINLELIFNAFGDDVQLN